MQQKGKRQYEVYGRFVIRGEGFIEIWRGVAHTAASAVRRAVSELWRRPAVRWKHVSAAVFALSRRDQKHKEPASHVQVTVESTRGTQARHRRH